jgi:hypothetical protein
MQPTARDVTLCHESQRGDDVAKASAYRTNEREVWLSHVMFALYLNLLINM